jgi:hypothetical protein
MAASIYKPLMFTTTVRNPERYKTLLDVLMAFDGQILTESIIDKVIFEFVAKKLYVPNYATRVQRLKDQLALDDVRFSDSDTAEIISNSPQNHKESGFAYGWASRFDTFYKFAKELGFVYYEMDKPIEVSESGLKLIKANEPEFVHLEQQVFLNAFVKYQRNNPFRRVLNKSKPFVLLLQTIAELRKIYGVDNAGITRQEISLILCWKDDNAAELAERIKAIRDKYSFTPSDDYIYDVCKDILDITIDGEKRFKKSNILDELPDEFIRKMRLTGLISLRGNGRFIDFNSLESEKIEYVLSKYTGTLSEFKTEREYYDYMRVIDTNLVSIEAKAITADSEKERLLDSWTDKFDLDSVKEELLIVCKLSKTRRHTSNEVLKYISEPTRFEFLTAIALRKSFPSLRVVPNYNTDDEGLPTSFAPGGGADIICDDNLGNILFEVTLLTGTQQNIREMPAIARHLSESILKYPNSFSVMICPRAHSDTLEYAKFVKFKDDLDISVIETQAFVDTLGVYSDAREYRLVIA